MWRKVLTPKIWIPEILFVYLGVKEIKIKVMKMDWKKMGFKSEKEYNDFLKTKMDQLMNKIKNDPKLLNVFKRLNDK